MRAAGYDMPGVIVDGADVLACYRAGREAIARARRGEGPTLIEAKVTRLTGHSSDDQQTKYRSAEELERGKARDPLPRFRAQLLDAGVLDEEQLARPSTAEITRTVEDATDWAQAQPEPDPATRRALRVREPEPGAPARAVRPGGPRWPSATLLDAIRETLADEMRRDETMIVLGEDVGVKGGVFLATDGLFAEFGGERVIDTPLTESLIVGASIGAAVNGLRPVPEIQFADFIFPAFNQIVSEAARLRYRSNGTFACPITIRAPYGGGVHGALYHSQSVEAFFAHVPGLRWSCPSRPYDARGLLRSASATPTRCSSSSTRSCTARCAARCPTATTSFPLGQAQVTRPGDHVTVIAYGLMAHYAWRRPSWCRPTASASRSSTCARCARSTARRSWARCARLASA